MLWLESGVGKLRNIQYCCVAGQRVLELLVRANQVSFYRFFGVILLIGHQRDVLNRKYRIFAQTDLFICSFIFDFMSG